MLDAFVSLSNLISFLVYVVSIVNDLSVCSNLSLASAKGECAYRKYVAYIWASVAQIITRNHCSERLTVLFFVESDFLTSDNFDASTLVECLRTESTSTCGLGAFWPGDNLLV
jgi:hypothetical protein